jgi:hypothetical protein
MNIPYSNLIFTKRIDRKLAIENKPICRIIRHPGMAIIKVDKQTIKIVGNIEESIDYFERLYDDLEYKVIVEDRNE